VVVDDMIVDSCNNAGREHWVMADRVGLDTPASSVRLL
jgi:hypothetical protein